MLPILSPDLRVVKLPSVFVFLYKLHVGVPVILILTKRRDQEQTKEHVAHTEVKG